MEVKPQMVCIDQKSFYASVECVDRGLDPLQARLVVADESRTDGTICLAVSPALKALGVPGRPRLFEAKQAIEAAEHRLGKKIDFIIAKPRMQRYLDVSAEIYAIFLKYIAPEDIHVYSIDESFLDLTHYLYGYGMTAHELTVTMIRDVLRTLGITATAGIGTNLYLAKIAMDITAKKDDPDRDGVRIAELDEQSFREKLWEHQPLTDFWMIAGGTSSHLERLGLHTMGDLARFSLHNQEILYREFGIDAELLIDHAWGQESCQLENIKRYRPSTKSLSSGQVLARGYPTDQARIVVREMTEEIIHGMIDQGLMAEGLTLYLGYERLKEYDSYSGPVKVDWYGRRVPKSDHGTIKLGRPTMQPSRIMEAAMELFERIVKPGVEVRRLSVSAIRMSREEDVTPQFSLFTDLNAVEREIRLVKAERRIQQRFGKDAIFKGIDLMEGGTTLERNHLIGGHMA